MHRNETPEDKTLTNAIDDSLRSAEKSLSILIKSKEVGADTLKELHDQGKQLNAVQEDVDTILYEDKIAKQSTRSISSIFWTLINKCIPSPTRPDNAKKVNDKIHASKTKPKKSKSTVKTLFSEGATDTSTFSDEDAKKIKKTDDILDKMGDYVKDLHVEAEQMGTEINDHNKRLDVLNKTTDEANTDHHKLTDAIHRLLRRF